MSQAATYMFLAINGARLVADAPATQKFVLARYRQNHLTFDKLVPWLRNFVVFDKRPIAPLVETFQRGYF